MLNRKKCRILVVEDDSVTVALLKMTLEEKYELRIAGNADLAWQILTNGNFGEIFDLILLDLTLPDSDGLTFFARIKGEGKLSGIPVFFLTGNSKIESKVLAFNMGGVDYLTKPFNPLELEARIKARLKNREHQQYEKFLRTENLELYPETHRAFILSDQGQHELKLTSTEFHLLKYFLMNKNSMLSRAQILDAVWASEANVTERTVDTHVSKLRKKLGPIGRIIESVHSEGYRLNELNPGSASKKSS